VSITNSEKKTTDSLYLTVEQVRVAACAWVTAQALPSSVRMIFYRQAARSIAYYQHRNQQARKSHRKKMLRRLRKLGIKVGQLNCCIPHDL